MLAWENLRLAPAAREDVLFCPSYSRPVFAAGRTVVTIFEATLKLYPEYFPKEHWYSTSRLYLRLYEWSGKHAVRVLTTTDAARQDIVRGYGIPAAKIDVVRLAANEAFRPLRDPGPLSAVRRRYVGDDVPFFLFVGKMTPRRNVPLLMEAFAAFHKAARRPRISCISTTPPSPSCSRTATKPAPR
jgi:glycosyltransferase involved in cell wall biosynthesis